MSQVDANIHEAPSVDKPGYLRVKVQLNTGGEIKEVLMPLESKVTPTVARKALFQAFEVTVGGKAWSPETTRGWVIYPFSVLPAYFNEDGSYSRKPLG